MGENSGIAWCDHTFNPWIGCASVSPACDRCYARALVNGRMGGDFDQRSRTALANWRKVIGWNRKAAAQGVRYRVFCASLADWADNQVPIEWLADLLGLIRETPHLDWLLLTKRPQLILRRLAAAMRHAVAAGDGPLVAWLQRWIDGDPPANVWLGTTAENQAELNRRAPALLDVPAAIHFLSCEPLLEPLNLRHIPISETRDGPDGEVAVTVTLDALTGWHEGQALVPRVEGEDLSKGLRYLPKLPKARAAVDWVIIGGESGSKARPYRPEWARDLIGQGRLLGTAYFHKQVGSRREGWDGITGKGDDPAEWPADLRCQEFPVPARQAVAA